MKRILPAWFSADPPAYPKSIGSTKLKKPAWDDDAEDRKKAAALYKEPATDLEASPSLTSGVFGTSARNYRQIWPARSQIGSLETDDRIAKAPPLAGISANTGEFSDGWTAG